MLPFTIQKVTSIEAAVAAASSGGRLIAGGTTLIDLMRDEVEQPQQLVDINALPLSDIRVDRSNLVIGALARMADIAAHSDVQRLYPLISESLIEGASPQLRNMASIGGNLLQRVRCPYFRMLDASCNKRSPGSGCAALDGLNAGHAILGTSDHCMATHPSDVAVALVALDATMRVRGPKGERTRSCFACPAILPISSTRFCPASSSSRCGSPKGLRAAGRAISRCATARPTNLRWSPRQWRSTSWTA